jgi:hypothetical protein
LRQTIPGHADLPPGRFPPGGVRHSLLPTKCPSCGGPILSDEVEWADPATAVCPYCGSGVRRGVE